ncbi:MAG TPA: fused MFS/spermidine synthase [Methylomirabilota bacterium]|nr:fused MFS/spermidine synthase [Methylomirabilota bacterium]
MDRTSTLADKRPSGSRGVSGEGLLTLAFTATLFFSAFLLFAIQPMFAKVVLPKLGGSASVWSIAMVFFQAMLLAGYGYAHWLTSRFSLRGAVIAHVATLTVCAMALPIGIPDGWGGPPQSGAAFWLIGLFLVSVGLPFFAVSVNGPLLQAWFSRTGDGGAQKDPYFLYGASNIGSFAALLGYPLVIETQFGAAAQTAGWSMGFHALMALVAGCGLLAIRFAANPAAAPRRLGVADAQAPPSLRRRLHWIGLAFVPSALLVAVTAHISTDIAAAPFLWVAPLALFLLTFVITFQQRPWLAHARMLALQPVALVALLLVIGTGHAVPMPVAVAVHLAAFFVNAMVCHGELVRLRPPRAHLTEFYLWMSFGGVLGGAFSGLLAPAIFSTVLEYPLMILAALACRPGLWQATTVRSDAAIVAAVALVATLPAAIGVEPGQIRGFPYVAGVFTLVMIAFIERKRDLRLLGIAGVAMTAAAAYEPSVAARELLRSFYGVHKIALSTDGEYRILVHGTTIHGAMRVRDANGAPVTGRPEPLTYYWSGSAMSRAVQAARSRHGTLGAVGVVGLGSGSLACQAESGEAWRFYEIDPEVVALARDPARFRFLADCAPDAAIVMGDARLTLAEETGPRFDVLVVDAFSSDAIPVHLLTREALTLYRARTAEDGLVVYHLSNRHMELVAEVAALAAAEGLAARVAMFAPPADEPMMAKSLVVAVAADDADFGPMTTAEGWTPVVPVDGLGAWTDDTSNVFRAIWRHYTGNKGYRLLP